MVCQSISLVLSPGSRPTHRLSRRSDRPRAPIAESSGVAKNLLRVGNTGDNDQLGACLCGRRLCSAGRVRVMKLGLDYGDALLQGPADRVNLLAEAVQSCLCGLVGHGFHRILASPSTM